MNTSRTAPSSPSTSSTRPTPTARSRSTELRLAGLARRRPRRWPAGIVGDRPIVGIVGPAFSGESKAADPIFDEAGLPTITPVGDQRRRCPNNGWKTFHRVLGNDDAQGPAVAKYIKDTVKAKKVVVIDDASEYGKGLADIVRTTSAPRVVGNDTIEPKADRLSAHRHQGEGLRCRRASSTAATTPRPAARQAARVTPASRARSSSVTASRTPASSTTPAPAAEGAIITCPCAPAGRRARLRRRRTRRSSTTDPGTYSPRGLRRRRRSCSTAIAAGKTDREPTCSTSSRPTTSPGVTKQHQVRRQGRGQPTSRSFAYKVEGGKIVSEGRDQVADRRVTIAAIAARPGPPRSAPGRCARLTSPRLAGGLGLRDPLRQLLDAAPSPAWRSAPSTRSSPSATRSSTACCG